MCTIADGRFALAVPNTGVTALNLNQEINLFGSCTRIYTTEVVTYPVIQDEPTQLKKDYGWGWNLLAGIGATLLFGALAVATVASGGAALAVVALAGAAVGTAAVTAGATYSDIKSGNTRSTGEFLFQLAMGAGIGFTAGASIYGLVTAIPAASMAMGVEASLLTGSTSTLTAVTIPNLVTAGGYGIAGGMGAIAINESLAMGSGTNVLLETVFDGDVQAYETATMCIEMFGMMYMECGAANAALGMYDSEEPGGNQGKKGVYLEGESGKNSNIDGAINNGQPLNNHRIVPDSEASSLPATKQTPNSSADLLNPDGSVKQRRYYGEDGKAQMDIDFNHTDDGTHEFPHIHIWDWTQKPPRQDSRR